MKPKVNERELWCRELYDVLLPALRYVAERYGYAIGVHGSLKRDIDLIAVPWREGAVSAESLVEGIIKACHAIVGIARLRERDEKPSLRPNGRKAWSIYLSVLDDAPYIDLSVMPTMDRKRKEKR